MNTTLLSARWALAILALAPCAQAANYFSPDSARMEPAANYGTGINVINGAGLPGSGVADLTDDNILTTSHSIGFNATTQFVRDGGVTSASFFFTFDTPVEVGSLYLWNYTQAGCCPGRGLGEVEIFLDTGAGMTSVAEGFLAEASDVEGSHFPQMIDLGAVYPGVVGIEIVATNNGGNAIGMDELVVSDASNGPSNPPAEISLSPNEIRDFLALAGTTVGTLGNDDPDFGDTHVYALVPGSGSDDNGLFEIVDDRLVLQAETPVGEYSVRVEVTDSEGASHQEVLTVSVVGDSAPVVTGLAGGVILAMLPAPQPAGRVLSDDPDFAATDQHQYALVPGPSDDDNGDFEIDPQTGDLTFTGTAEAGRSYSIRVGVTDLTSLTTEAILTVTARSSFGRPLSSRSFATDNATTVLHPNQVPMPIDTEATGVDIYLQNLSQQAGRTVHLILLRPTGNPDEFEVVYDSGVITIGGTTSGEVVNFPFPNGPVSVQAGDHFAHFGSGIPYSQGTAESTPIYFSVAAPPAVDSVIQLGPTSEAAYPFRGDLARDYAWAISHEPGIEPLTDVAISHLPDSERLELTWTAREGHRYRIEGSADLLAWPDLIASDFAPATTEAVFQFDQPAGNAFFFRVIDLGRNP